MMKDLILSTAENFRKKWGDEPGMRDEPHPIDVGANLEVITQYCMFVKEEMDEILTAIRGGGTPEEKQKAVADGMCDGLVYLATMVSRTGFLSLMPYLYREVARSNNTKGEGGVLFNESGKMIKGPNYRKPDFSRFWASELAVTHSFSDDIFEQPWAGDLTFSDRKFYTVIGYTAIAENPIPPFWIIAKNMPECDIEQHILP